MILGAGIPAGPIYNVSDIMEDPHIRDDREMFIHVDHPVMGDVILNGNPVKLSDTKVGIRFPLPHPRAAQRRNPRKPRLHGPARSKGLRRKGCSK